MTSKLFTRSIPEKVTWNEFFDVCERAQMMSELLDKRNAERKREGRATFLKTARRHNHVVRQIWATIDHPSFGPWAASQDMFRGDLPLVRYASHPQYL